MEVVNRKLVIGGIICITIGVKQVSPAITLVLSLVITKSEISSLCKKLHYEYSGALCYLAKPKSKNHKFYKTYADWQTYL